MKRKILFFVMLMIFPFAACGSGDETTDNQNESDNQGEVSENIQGETPESTGFEATEEFRVAFRPAFDGYFDIVTGFNLQYGGGYLDDTIFEKLRESPAEMLQFSPLTPGEELAILHTNHGDITLRFFPEEAPLAVANFKTHARNGFYDGLLFHRVMPGFMIQGGCPLGTGGGGESIWGETFGLERSFNLLHFRGALAMAHRGPDTMSSQFYIVQSDDVGPGFQEVFETFMNNQDEIHGEFSDGQHILVRERFPASAMLSYIAHGGTPHLDWHWNVDQLGRNYGHTVFGHVVGGMETVDAIANVPQYGNNRPVEDVIIERISFVNY
ncbi:MAG: peptidylprolyl isomerase [Defluviitaleaceae bacterium]|nr:peptidylprolyl isomerase [Defluviitaleaceae bacterium]